MAYQDQMDAFRQKVIVAVKSQLGKEHWFSGVHMDDVEEYFPDDLQGAIDHAYCNTLYWDAPNHGFPTI